MSPDTGICALKPGNIPGSTLAHRSTANEWSTVIVNPGHGAINTPTALSFLVLPTGRPFHRPMQTAPPRRRSVVR